MTTIVEPLDAAEKVRDHFENEARSEKIVLLVHDDPQKLILDKCQNYHLVNNKEGTQFGSQNLGDDVEVNIYQYDDGRSYVVSRKLSGT